MPTRAFGADQMYTDADRLAVDEVRELPPAAWEPNSEASWRDAVSAWYAAARGVIHEEYVMTAEIRLAGRSAREQSLATAFRLPHSPEREHLIQTIHDTEMTYDNTDRALLATNICERDNLGASYRAGLAAGGEAIDWVAWYLERIAAWPDPRMAAPARARLDDPTFCAEVQTLPAYWT